MSNKAGNRRMLSALYRPHCWMVKREAGLEKRKSPLESNLRSDFESRNLLSRRMMAMLIWLKDVVIGPSLLKQNDPNAI